MSGHSKWANMHRTKEKVDAKRGKIFTKLGKEIMVAVKVGGSADPNVNAKLYSVIQKAKANNMPNDNISRLLKKASGEGGNANYSEILYEGYGVGGSAVLVYTLTDNKNRTAGDVRHIFEKNGGSLGNQGCVSFMFNRKNLITIEANEKYTEDDVMMLSLDLNAEDVKNEEVVYEVYFDPSTDINELKVKYEENGFIVVSAESSMLPSSYVDLTEEQYEKFQKMIDLLEELDDVDEVYHNVE